MVFNTFMILVLAGMCAAKTVVQGRIGKDLLSTTGSVLFFNGIYFAAAMLCTLPGILTDRSSIAVPTVTYGALFGLISVLFQFSATSGMRYGPVSLTVLIVNLSCSIPIIVGILVWHEKPSPWFFPGLILMVIALVLGSDLKDLHIPSPHRWAGFVALAFICSGSLNVIQKLHQFTSASSQRSWFVMTAYLVSTVIAVLSALAFSRDRSILRQLLEKKTLGLTVIVGIILCAYQQLCLFMAHRMPGSVMYPMLSGMTLVACTLVGVICFKDPFRIKQKLCVFSGIGAVILLSL